MKFKHNDMVRIKDSYYTPLLRGKIGKVAIAPSNVLQNQNSLWIEFDPFILDIDGSLIDAMEVQEYEIELIEEKNDTKN